MAEGEGFEPSIRFPAYTLSKRAPSATRPPLLRSWKKHPRRRKLTEAEAPCNGYYVFMRWLFNLGLLLLGIAFLLAAAENAAHAIPGVKRSIILPARDLWYALSPQSLLVFELKVTRYVGDWLWDPVLISLLKLPAWLLSGTPGVLLVTLCRHRRSDITDDDMRGAEESHDLFNELTRQAKAELPPGEEHGYQDMLPEDAPTDGEPIDPIRPTEFVHGKNPFTGKDGKL